jgi:hypothetical protein
MNGENPTDHKQKPFSPLTPAGGEGGKGRRNRALGATVTAPLCKPACPFRAPGLQVQGLKGMAEFFRPDQVSDVPGYSASGVFGSY